MKLHDEQVFARKVMNTVIEVFQGIEGFNDWFTKLDTQTQLHLSITLMKFLKKNIREIETSILEGRFLDEREDGKDV